MTHYVLKVTLNPITNKQTNTKTIEITFNFQFLFNNAVSESMLVHIYGSQTKGFEISNHVYMSVCYGQT